MEQLLQFGGTNNSLRSDVNFEDWFPMQAVAGNAPSIHVIPNRGDESIDGICRIIFESHFAGLSAPLVADDQHSPSLNHNLDGPGDRCRAASAAGQPPVATSLA